MRGDSSGVGERDVVWRACGAVAVGLKEAGRKAGWAPDTHEEFGALGTTRRYERFLGGFQFPENRRRCPCSLGYSKAPQAGAQRERILQFRRLKVRHRGWEAPGPSEGSRGPSPGLWGWGHCPLCPLPREPSSLCDALCKPPLPGRPPAARFVITSTKTLFPNQVTLTGPVA